MYKKLAKELLNAYNNEVTNDCDTPYTCHFNVTLLILDRISLPWLAYRACVEGYLPGRPKW